MNKVLAIAPYTYLPYFSGGQKFIARFLDYLGKEVDLTVISVDGNDFSIASSYKGLPLLKRSKSRYFDRSLVNKISGIIRQEKFDTLIIEHPYYAWLAFALRKQTGIKVVIHTHNIEYQRFRSTGKWWWPLLRNYEKKAFKKADAVVFISEDDEDFAIDKWHIKKDNSYVLPFGIDYGSYPAGRSASRQKISSLHNISKDEKILLFTGLLNYKPNKEALNLIVEKIDPLLKMQNDFSYRIIVCGKGLDKEIQNRDSNIIYAGFVENIAGYYEAADIMLNPLLSGGGVKTKLVEAIGSGTTVVSTKTGAAGVDKELCGSKLVVVPDNDWGAFAQAIISNASLITETPAGFYEKYSWPRLVKHFIKVLPGKLTGHPKDN